MLSVILPTIRPHRVGRALDSLLDQRADVVLEVVVVADFAPTLAGVTWIERERRGVIDAVHAGYQAARGDVVFLTNDETICAPGCLRTLYEAAMDRPDVLFAPRHEPAYPFFYYGKFFAAFPCGHRSLFDHLGGFLDPVYRGFYADPDLSMRAHAAGVPIEAIDQAVIYHANQHDDPHAQAVSAYLEQDRATFRSRWDHLGAFCDP